MKKPCVDHLGRQYGSRREMAAAWDQDESLLRARLRIGWSLKDALETRPHFKHAVTGPDGRVYQDMKTMCAENGVSYAAVLNRMSRNDMDLATAVEDARRTDMDDRTDHTGHVHPSIRKMCEYWNIGATTYQYRISKGFSKKEALTAPCRKNSSKWTGPDGRAFNTVASLAGHWHVNPSSVKYRVNDGHETSEGAVMHMCMTTWPGMRFGEYAVIRCIRWPWFLCEDRDGIQLMLDANKIRDMKHTE